MTNDEFWSLVEAIHHASPNDMEAKCALLKEKLRALDLNTIGAFLYHFWDFNFRAYTWDLWAAAFIIGGGCSDDGFMDFRSSLVSLGRETFERALANPDSLADLEVDPSWAEYEGYQYVASHAWNEKSAEEIPFAEFPPHPKEPIGERFVEWDLERHFPKLCAKFGYRDKSAYPERDRQKAMEKRHAAAFEFANQLLVRKIIPPSGLIPPYTALAGSLQSGHFQNAAGAQLNWHIPKLDQNIFWPAITILENFSPTELQKYPHLKATSLKLDTPAKSYPTLADWYAFQAEEK